MQAGKRVDLSQIDFDALKAKFDKGSRSATGNRTRSSRSVFPSTGTRSTGAVHVRGYYRKDGTYVAPHYRSAPDGNPYNNYSFLGNYNPFTGKTATGDPATYLRNYYNRSASSNFAFSTNTADVSSLQLGLGILGFSPGIMTGSYTDETRAAVKSFQTEAGLSASGEVDLTTLGALISELEAFRDSMTTDVLPANAQTSMTDFQTSARVNDFETPQSII